MSEIVQDLISGSRPNVSAYQETSMMPIPIHEAESSVASYAHLAIFTGQDEQYAFQRAVSRLHELTRPGGSGKPWAPMLGVLNDLWNKSVNAQGGIVNPSSVSPAPADEDTITSDTGLLRRPPSISANHVWGVAEWGKRAGRWGRGAEVYKKTKIG